MLMGCFPGEQKIQDSQSCRRFVSKLMGKFTKPNDHEIRDDVRPGPLPEGEDRGEGERKSNSTENVEEPPWFN